MSELEEVGRGIGLSSEVPLRRAPTDREWEMVVAELRITFGGAGQTTEHGGSRTWS